MPEQTPSLPEPTPPGFLDDTIRFGRMLRAGWRTLAATVAVFVALAGLYLLLATHLYEATGRLLVLQQTGQPLNVGNPDPTRPLESGTDDYIPTQVAILRSHVVVKAAIDALGLDNLPTLQAVKQQGRDPLQKAIDSYLKVTRPERLARVIEVSFWARSGDEAVRMVEAITTSYKEFLDEKYPRGSEVVALIKKARGELERDLAQAEKEYLDFRRKNPMLVTDEKGRSFMTNRLERWDKAMNEAQVREVQIRAQLELGQKLSREGAGLWSIVHAMNQMNGDTSNGLLNYTTNAASVTSWDYVRQLSQEQQQLAERYGPRYSKVQELQEQITRIQERVRESRSRYEQVEIGDLLKALTEGVKRSEAMRAEMNKGFEQDRKIESDFMVEMSLRNNLDRRRALFNALVDQFKAAQVAGDLSPVAAKVLEPPTANPEHVWPRSLLTLVLALLGGSLVGAGLVALRNRLAGDRPQSPNGTPAMPGQDKVAANGQVPTAVSTPKRVAAPC